MWGIIQAIILGFGAILTARDGGRILNPKTPRYLKYNAILTFIGYGFAFASAPFILLGVIFVLGNLAGMWFGITGFVLRPYAVLLLGLIFLYIFYKCIAVATMCSDKFFWDNFEKGNKKRKRKELTVL